MRVLSYTHTGVSYKVGGAGCRGVRDPATRQARPYKVKEKRKEGGAHSGHGVVPNQYKGRQPTRSAPKRESHSLLYIYRVSTS